MSNHQKKRENSHRCLCTSLHRAITFSLALSIELPLFQTRSQQARSGTKKKSEPMISVSALLHLCNRISSARQKKAHRYHHHMALYVKWIQLPFDNILGALVCRMWRSRVGRGMLGWAAAAATEEANLKLITSRWIHVTFPGSVVRGGWQKRFCYIDSAVGWLTKLCDRHQTMWTWSDFNWNISIVKCFFRTFPNLTPINTRFTTHLDKGYRWYALPKFEPNIEMVITSREPL